MATSQGAGVSFTGVMRTRKEWRQPNYPKNKLAGRSGKDCDLGEEAEVEYELRNVRISEVLWDMGDL